jgi:hypothetical protein
MATLGLYKPHFSHFLPQSSKFISLQSEPFIPNQSLSLDRWRQGGEECGEEDTDTNNGSRELFSIIEEEDETPDGCGSDQEEIVEEQEEGILMPRQEEEPQVLIIPSISLNKCVRKSKSGGETGEKWYIIYYLLILGTDMEF